MISVKEAYLTPAQIYCNPWPDQIEHSPLRNGGDYVIREGENTLLHSWVENWNYHGAVQYAHYYEDGFLSVEFADGCSFWLTPKQKR